MTGSIAQKKVGGSMSNPNTPDGLKPCPFCGGEAEVSFSHELGRWDIYEVECLPCGVSRYSPTGYEGDDAEAEAIAAWNTRPSPVSEDGLVERLNETLVIEYAVPLPVMEVLQRAADERAEAASLIASQKAEIERLRTALEPFARYAELNDLADRDPDDAIEVPVRDLRAALASYQGDPK